MVSEFLITGGAGFIGSHLAERCLVLGHPVVVLDDLRQGKRENVARLLDQPRFALVEASVCDRKALDEHVAHAAVVFHLAASSIPAAEGAAGPIVVQQNHDATAAVLDAAAKFDKKVVLASSGEVYQDNQLTAYVECDPVDPLAADQRLAPCRSSKIADERLAEESPADTVVARLFPTIGPRLGFGLGGEIGRFVLENMLKVLRRQAIVIDGELPQRISIVDVSDVVHWLMLLACEPRAVGRVFNLGSPTAVSARQLAEKIAQVADAPVEIRDVTESNGNGRPRPPSRIPDITRVLKLTKYSPRTKLDESLRKIHAWMTSDEVYAFIAAMNNDE